MLTTIEPSTDVLLAPFGEPCAIAQLFRMALPTPSVPSNSVLSSDPPLARKFCGIDGKIRAGSTRIG